MGRLPLRGRLPRYRRVDDTSVMFAAICFPGDQVMQRQGLGWTDFLGWVEAKVRRQERSGTGNGSLIVGCGRWEVVWFGMLTVCDWPWGKVWKRDQ